MMVMTIVATNMHQPPTLNARFQAEIAGDNRADAKSPKREDARVAPNARFLRK